MAVTDAGYRGAGPLGGKGNSELTYHVSMILLKSYRKLNHLARSSRMLVGFVFGGLV